MTATEELQFEGCSFFQLRLSYSLLSGRPIIIQRIRADDEVPGIRDHEMKLLRLIDNITNGTRVEISKTGTRLRFVPGVLIGGEVFQDCGLSRCISYFLELLLVVSPFCKKPLHAQLTGVTNAPGELSVEAIRSTWLPVYTNFIMDADNLQIKMPARGLLPEGGGRVVFTAPIVKRLRPVQREKSGKVRKIRGTAWVAKVSPSLAHRLIESAKLALRGYLADVYVTVDQRKGAAGGNSAGYGLILTAETTEGIIYHGEEISFPKGSDQLPKQPEDVGTGAAHKLLQQIFLGGCSDGTAQGLAATFMALGEKDASKFLLGDLTAHTVGSLRHLKEFFNVVFKFDEWKEGEKAEEEGGDLRLGSKQRVLATAIGVGYSNLNKLIL